MAIIVGNDVIARLGREEIHSDYYPGICHYQQAVAEEPYLFQFGMILMY